MSYEIFYKKAFIKVNNKYIPMVNSGANNCYDIDAFGREIPENAEKPTVICAIFTHGVDFAAAAW